MIASPVNKQINISREDPRKARERGIRLPIVGQAHRLPRIHLDCSPRGNRVAETITFPNRVWERGGVICEACRSPSSYREGAVLSSTRMKCIVVVPMFSAAWVNGSRYRTSPVFSSVSVVLPSAV
jgi:hypothetical protein